MAGKQARRFDRAFKVAALARMAAVDPSDLAINGFQDAQPDVDARQAALDPLQLAAQIGHVRLQPVELGIHAAQQPQRVIGGFGHGLILHGARVRVENPHAARSYPTAISTRSPMMSWISKSLGM